MTVDGIVECTSTDYHKDLVKVTFWFESHQPQGPEKARVLGETRPTHPGRRGPVWIQPSKVYVHNRWSNCMFIVKFVSRLIWMLEFEKGTKIIQHDHYLLCVVLILSTI